MIYKGMKVDGRRINKLKEVEKIVKTAGKAIRLSRLVDYNDYNLGLRSENAREETAIFIMQHPEIETIRRSVWWGNRFGTQHWKRVPFIRWKER